MAKHVTEKIAGIEMIAAERDRQIQEEGWSLSHDREHSDNSLAHAAVAYAMGGGRLENIDGSRVIDIWPTSWGAEADTIKGKPRLRQLVIAGALIAAEIDRLQKRRK
jgi:hypothetical protein